MQVQDEQPFIPCLNFCRTDPESGYCLTCGRPPAPVSSIDLGRPVFSESTLAALRAMSDAKADA